MHGFIRTRIFTLDLRQSSMLFEPQAVRLSVHLPRDVNDLVSQSRHRGFDEVDFGFKNHRRRFDDKCMATIPLPDYDIVGIRTGEHARDIIWEA